MIRKLLCAALVISASLMVQAQFTIPDPDFASKLQQIVPNAMSGNVLDTLHPDVLQLDVMQVPSSSISDLSGIRFFTGLQDLNCNNNGLHSIPPLPVGLKRLWCGSNTNFLMELPDLPDSLNTLWCKGNNLQSLPVLPPLLETLNCEGNGILNALPNLPSSLRYLDCAQTGLSALPALPNGLRELNCRTNPIISLPTLPDSMRILQVNNLLITSLPALPDSIERIWCGTNYLTSLPALPPRLEWLDCGYNDLQNALGPFPSTLERLEFHNNDIDMLHPLPLSLEYLDAYQNEIDWLPSLPPGLEVLKCAQNNLTSLPPIPASLLELNCGGNQIPLLPELNNGLLEIWCANSSMNCLPILPQSLLELHSQGTGFSCLPNIPPNLDLDPGEFGFTANVCLYNSPCFPGEAITGSVIHDDNGNGLKDPGEMPFLNGVVEAMPGAYLTAPGVNGSYVLPVDTGSYSLDGQEVLYHNKTTSTQPVIITLNSIDSLNNIGYQVIPGIFDLVVDVEGSPARPGFDNNIWLSVWNIGTESTLATIDLTFDGDQTWVTSDSVPDMLAGNTATWFYSIAPGGSWSTKVELNTAVNVPLGTSIDHLFSAVPQLPDTTPSDNFLNYSSEVVGSYDPNDKVNDPSSMVPMQIQNGEFIEYTIRFQNTGTFPAEQVVITDTMSTDLQWNSIQFVSSSHTCNWYMVNGILHFIHDPIFLPDSTSDEPNSHGFVKFRMKPVSTLMIGEQIENVANIYFDFNEPVITDPAVFEVSIPTEISELENVGFEMYPNPTNGNVTISSAEMISVVEVMQLDGRLVHTSSGNSDRHVLGTDGLASGTYLVSVHFDGGASKSQLLLIQ